ncbi:serine/threonine protein phosphatase [Sphingomonas sanguinis]|uniref:Serine/threonine protein phosphatase n=2 Tax=Sphingomonas sanguinis TaxID=33051 RepID=A0A147J8M9_9SPHN|nr:serine/threonine protein phosphatase [Sphingomonas sanguinis]
MLAKLLNLRKRVPEFVPAMTPGLRVYAVGDIHGRLDLLDRILMQIDADHAARPPAERHLVFLGDLVDRGPDSAGVVERIRTLAEGDPHVHCLMGNHEEIFLRSIEGDDKALRLFCRIGGRETLISYGVTPEDYERLDYAEVVEQLLDRVPSVHRDFLTSLQEILIMGDYVFVHAGIRPGIPIAEQKLAETRWIRDPFLDHRAPLEKMVVHGHTVAEEAEMLPHRIGIDTGAYHSDRLTALMLENTDRHVFST